VRIGDRLVGPGAPAYIIAEAGVNHDGSRADALRLVDVAAEAGADAVKFQIFRAAELATAAATTATYQRAAGHRSQRKMLTRLELSDEDFAAIRAYCRRRSIEFLATPFTPADLDRLEPLDVRAIKIASTDVDNAPLLRRACQAGLPLIVSTGASTTAELRRMVLWLRTWGAGARAILLHCVSCYPTPLEAANLRAIQALRDAFALPCGYSDHTRSTETGAWAVLAGACALEKHFTLDRTASGPDHALSLTPPELGQYITAVRRAELALGTGTVGLTELEFDVRAVARKSAVTRRPLKAGTALAEDVLAFKRPGGGIPPDQLRHVIGRRLTVAVPADTMLTWDMLR